jgi:hypothetical protein
LGSIGRWSNMVICGKRLTISLIVIEY